MCAFACVCRVCACVEETSPPLVAGTTQPPPFQWTPPSYVQIAKKSAHTGVSVSAIAGENTCNDMHMVDDDNNIAGNIATKSVEKEFGAKPPELANYGQCSGMEF